MGGGQRPREGTGTGRARVQRERGERGERGEPCCPFLGSVTEPFPGGKRGLETGCARGLRLPRPPGLGQRVQRVCRGRGLEGGGPRRAFSSPLLLLGAGPRDLSGGGPAPPPPRPNSRSRSATPAAQGARRASERTSRAFSARSLGIMRPGGRAPFLLLQLLPRPERRSSRQAAALLSRAQTGPSPRDLSDS